MPRRVDTDTKNWLEWIFEKASIGLFSLRLVTEIPKIGWSGSRWKQMRFTVLGLLLGYQIQRIFVGKKTIYA